MSATATVVRAFGAVGVGPCGGGSMPSGQPRPPCWWTLDFRTLAHADFDAIAHELNGRPRQTLGFKTPSQAPAKVLR